MNIIKQNFTPGNLVRYWAVWMWKKIEKLGDMIFLNLHLPVKLFFKVLAFKLLAKNKVKTNCEGYRIKEGFYYDLGTIIIDFPKLNITFLPLLAFCLSIT